MDAQLSIIGEQQRRSAERVHLFLAAMLRWNGSDCAVRIRNLSAHGAMIEGAALPAADQPVQLARGGLRVTGRVAWSDARRCGLQLDQPIHIPSWSAAPTNSAQARVDSVVAALRRGEVPGIWLREVTAAPADDLALAQRMLTDLADRLADDDEVIARCGHHLQRLDIVVQLLGALGHGADGARLSDLRVAARAALKG